MDNMAVNHDKNKAAQSEKLKVLYFEETEALSRHRSETLLFQSRRSFNNSGWYYFAVQDTPTQLESASTRVRLGPLNL